MYVFGDSYSDIGEGYLDGNGPTAVAYFAHQLGINLLPANAAPTAHDSLDFAISGAGTGSGSGTQIDGALLGVGMHKQVDDFHEMVIEGSLRFRPESTLFFIAGGLNDDKLPSRITAQNLTYVVQTLYASGARNFVIALLPTAIPSFSAVGRRLNPVLARLHKQLLLQFSGAHITLSRWGLYFDDVILHPAQYGFTDISEPCAGRAIFHQDPTPCRSPDTHFYFHEGHPSTAVNRIVGNRLHGELQDACIDRTLFPSERRKQDVE